ncbi:MAG: hypothetical protein ABJH07_20020 [Sedimentitalea sp.]|uniref:hypothetical protein n=1 Tax=Sedimentitalea sp. TaxID=2048915 RepID=UPI003263DAE7
MLGFYSAAAAWRGVWNHLSGTYQLIATSLLGYLRKQIEMAGSIPPNPQETIEKPYLRFISENDLALYLHCSSAGYASGLFDVLTIPKITRSFEDEDGVPEIYAMLNVMKADFAFARQVFFETHEWPRPQMLTDPAGNPAARLLAAVLVEAFHDLLPQLNRAGF